MTALVTGFAPFGRWSVNSSGEGATALGASRPGLAVETLPVDHDAAPRALLDAVARVRPDVVLLTGLADEPRLRLEIRARRPAAWRDAPGDAAPVLHGLWPWAAALDAMRATGAPARLSNDPGRYVCETTYWAALATGCAPRVAFLHTPPLGAGWDVARIAAAMGACLDAALSATSRGRPPC